MLFRLTKAKAKTKTKTKTKTESNFKMFRFFSNCDQIRFFFPLFISQPLNKRI